MKHHLKKRNDSYKDKTVISAESYSPFLAVTARQNPLGYIYFSELEAKT